MGVPASEPDRTANPGDSREDTRLAHADATRGQRPIASALHQRIDVNLDDLVERGARTAHRGQADGQVQGVSETERPGRSHPGAQQRTRQ